MVKELAEEYSIKEKKILDANAIEISEANAILRHKIAGPLSNLVFYAENIKKVLSEKILTEVPELFQTKLNENQIFNLGELLNNLVIDSRFITKEVRNQTEKLNLFDYAVTEIDILRWLENYINVQQEKHKNILITNNFAILNFEGLMVKANEDLLRILFDNLFNNIFTHGFASEFEGNKRIEIEISADSVTQLCTIFLSNTGIPFPKNFSMEDYGRKGIKSGETAGNGIGGYFVKSIINHLSGEWYITDETGNEGLPDTDLATTFEITLPYYY